MADDGAAGGTVEQGSGTAEPTPVDEPIRKTASFIDGRVREYADLWKNAADQLAKGEYRSSDLITDWFTLWGRGARDIQTVAQAWWQVGTAGPIGEKDPASVPQRTIFNDCVVDLSSELKQKQRPLVFATSDIAYRDDRTVAVPASNVTLEPHVDPTNGIGFVRVTIDATGLNPGLLLGFLYETKNPTTPISAVNMSVPRGYSRY